MSATLLQLRKEEYIVLLLIYASNADFYFTDGERSKIIHLYGKSLFNQMNELYHSLREYELLTLICEGRSHFYPGLDGKEHILDLLKGHFQEDGEYSRIEKSQYNFLEKLL